MDENDPSTYALFRSNAQELLSTIPTLLFISNNTILMMRWIVKVLDAWYLCAQERTSAEHRFLSLTRSYQCAQERTFSSRLAFMREKVNDMNTKLALVKDDSRAVAESSTMQQTWQELEEMTNERLGGKRTRPSSVIGSLCRGSSFPTLTSPRVATVWTTSKEPIHSSPQPNCPSNSSKEAKRRTFSLPQVAPFPGGAIEVDE
ncbi:hypothetical protein M378DRAFT_872871 [Amanita muscaria Koide BX008]|uniref:Uncharacterized protein n=1 Tax=Amanita muscaria (strain Koide BX008) TaxID=946122 RepID=A0A0C2WC53_AMAMK|nr:hypothetical protein M378DRAFT_872871 [Amanita muscaria Koide BX008]